jgi:hypothetical protein
MTVENKIIRHVQLHMLMAYGKIGMQIKIRLYRKLSYYSGEVILLIGFLLAATVLVCHNGDGPSFTVRSPEKEVVHIPQNSCTAVPVQSKYRGTVRVPVE